MRMKVSYEYSKHVTVTKDGLVIHGILFPYLGEKTLQMFKTIQECPTMWEALAALHRLPKEEQAELCNGEDFL